MSDKLKENVSLSEMIKNVATLEYIYNKGILIDPNKSEMFKNVVNGMDEKTTALLTDEYIKQYDNLNANENFSSRISFYQFTEEARSHYVFNRSTSLKEFVETVVKSKDYELIFTKNYSDKESIPSDNDIIYFGSERTIKPSDYYGHSLNTNDIVVISNNDSKINARFFDGISFTKFPAPINETMQKKVEIGLDVRKESEILKSIRAVEVNTGKKILTDGYNDRYNKIENDFSKAFKSADIRAENPITYKNINSLDSLYPGDVIFLNQSFCSIDIDYNQSIVPSSDIKYVGYDARTGKEVKFSFDEIDIVHRQDIEFNKEVGELDKSKESNRSFGSNIGMSKGNKDDQSNKTKSQWLNAIKEAKQKSSETNSEKQNTINRNDKTR